MPQYFRYAVQPWKGLYIAYFVLFALFIRLPLWGFAAIWPGWRPRRSWSWLRTMRNYMNMSVVEFMQTIGMRLLPDVEENARNADKLGFVWVDPVPGTYVQGEIAQMAKTNGVVPARISGYWHGKRNPEGKFGYLAAPGEKVMYWLRGSGYVNGTSAPGSLPLEPMLTGIMAHSCGLITRTFGLDYRLSATHPHDPVNPYPAALIDVVSGYRYLVATLGFAPADVILMGDSSGGHLGLNLVRYLISASLPSLPPPGAVMLLHPSLDWALTHDMLRGSSMQRNYYADYVYAVFDSRYTAQALLGALPVQEIYTNAWLSPASLTIDTAGLFKDFPPTVVVAGEAEVSVDPMRTLRDRLRADNGPETITYLEYEDAFHEFIAMEWFEPQRTRALKDLEAWFEKVFLEK
ncbi:hypothetical protein CERSUDRAFT_126382 [Gelatoporia subvermispora B]|uniref:Alpha/beta hydrolase fold-3 domain-containing protein n=1 Tax=Ceriporiopsis subvermispora (strain B) TaxID=914234 RepID=M2R4Y1_CERS8|nr:hypothetical protein CERSUDRAFT_126382 [Gelatoporia subvermispora B]